MSKLSEEKAVEYQIKTHGPNVMGGASILSEDEYMQLNMNRDFKAGYEQAEKDTIERAAKWLEDNAFEYVKTKNFSIYELYDTYDSDALLADFEKAMTEEK